MISEMAHSETGIDIHPAATIGEGATIGGNIWVTENVEPGARILQQKAEK